MALTAVKQGADEDHQEKCLSQLYDHMPEGLTPLATLKNIHQRRQLGTPGLFCSFPLWAPFHAQLILLTDRPRQVPRAGPGKQGILGHPTILDQKPWGMVCSLGRPLGLCSRRFSEGLGLPEWSQSYGSLPMPSWFREWPLVIQMWKGTFINFLLSHLRTGDG